MSQSVEHVLRIAIADRRRVSLRGRSDSGSRVVEPHVVYETEGGVRFLDFYQTRGYSASGRLPGWRRLRVDEISRATPLKQSFLPRTAEGYNPGHARFAEILCRV